MSKREAKKDHLLDHGLKVMKEKGYNGSSVKDIVDAAKVPKGSFYNYFESKETFALQAIEKVSEESYEEAKEILLSETSPLKPLDNLAQYFTRSIENACDDGFKVGCFMGNMCQEMADSNDVIRQKIQTTLIRHTQLIEEVLILAKQQGEISDDIDTSTTAEFLFNAWEGSLMRMKAAKCSEPLDAFLKMLPVICNRQTATD